MCSAYRSVQSGTFGRSAGRDRLNEGDNVMQVHETKQPMVPTPRDVVVDPSLWGQQPAKRFFVGWPSGVVTMVPGEAGASAGKGVV
jgi:hypothetical protein